MHNNAVKMILRCMQRIKNEPQFYVMHTAECTANAPVDMQRNALKRRNATGLVCYGMHVNDALMTRVQHAEKQEWFQNAVKIA